MKINYTVEGATELERAFENTQFIIGELTEAVGKGNQVVRDLAKTYPPPPANSTYQRTGLLGNSWTMETQPYATGVNGFVKNAVEYGKWVMGPETQAAVHRGRWNTTKQVWQLAKAQVETLLAQARDRIVARLRS